MEIFAINFFDRLDDFTCKFLLSQVSNAKRERLLKFYNWEDLQRGLLADLLVRKALIEKVNVSNNEIHFSVNEYGKPYCSFLKNFHFNVSHSGSWVVCAIDSNPIGIDIERISQIDLDISKNYFSKKEHENLLLSNNPFDYFFTLWSLKESYIKFIGKGLSHPLDSFSIVFSNNSKINIEVNAKILENTFFKQYDVDKVYKMAVCCSHPDMPEKPVVYNISDLVDFFSLQEKLKLT
ncbi:MAG: 4'-phosphopantetheinyl transferase superfamily protein [Bacteroidales bacterium]|nr:4'-phosphopantetheinyl transferase superfamily protein [Bacteroidales bacterium]